ncbi:MAG: hypothetical protein Q9187_003493 [Circinaria calcarea]
MRDGYGNELKGADGRVYLAFDLPAQLPIKPPAHLLEYYTDRLDPRIGTRDLYIRMRPGPGEKLLNPNAINMQKKRFRKHLNIACWLRPTKLPTLDECLEKEQIAWTSVQRNTSLPVDRWGLGGGSLPRLPLTRFTKGINKLHVPSPRLIAVYNLIEDLQNEAFDNKLCHWIFLPNSKKPKNWQEKAESQKHSRIASGDIKFPAPQDITPRALAWIKEQIIAAAAGESEMDIPDLAELPGHSKKWVESCIQLGRARAAQCLPMAITNPYQGISSTDAYPRAGTVDCQTETQPPTLPMEPKSRKRKGSFSELPQKRIKSFVELAQGKTGVPGLDAQPNTAKRKQVSYEGPNKRARYQQEYVPAPISDHVSESSSLFHDDTPLASNPVFHNDTLLAPNLVTYVSSPEELLPTRYRTSDIEANAGKTHHTEAPMGIAPSGNDEGEDNLDRELMKYSLLADEALKQGIDDATVTRMWETGCDLTGRRFRNMETQVEQGLQVETCSGHGHRSKEATEQIIEEALDHPVGNGNNHGLRLFDCSGHGSKESPPGRTNNLLSFFSSTGIPDATLMEVPTEQLSELIQDHQLTGNIYPQNPFGTSYSTEEVLSEHPRSSELFAPADWDNQWNIENTGSSPDMGNLGFLGDSNNHLDISYVLGGESMEDLFSDANITLEAWLKDNGGPHG